MNIVKASLPLLFALVLLVALYQFVEQHWSANFLSHLLASLYGWRWYFLIAAVCGWALILLGRAHADDRLPVFLHSERLMDILDRLTN